MVAWVSSARSSRFVNSISTASPRVRISVMMRATAASTSSAVSRLSARSAANSSAKPDARASSLRGIGRLAEAIDPGADLLRPGLERGAIHDHARGDLGDPLDLHQAVRPQRGAGLYEIDDAPAEAELRRKLHGTVELDALRLYTAGGKMPAGDLRIFGGDAHPAPARRSLLLRDLLRGRYHEPTVADLEIERRIDLRVLELHQDVVAGDAQMRGAEGDEGRDVEIAHAHDVEPGMVGLEAQLARILVGELALDLD